MWSKLQFKRGLKKNLPTLLQGEIAYTTDEKSVYVGNGDENIRLMNQKDKSEIDTQLTSITNETIYLASYNSTDYDSVFRDIASRVNNNSFTTIVLDSRSIVINSNFTFTKPVKIIGNKCKISKTSNGLYLRFAGDSKIESIELNGIALAIEPNNIQLDDITVRNVDGTASSIYRAGFIFFVRNNLSYKNVSVKNCQSINNYDFGFDFRDTNANGEIAEIIEDVYFENCHATSCGKNPKGWSSGFVIHYTKLARNWSFVNCTAKDNLESGFHCEASINRENILFLNCISSGNGVTGIKNAKYGYGFFNYPEFSFINCVAKGNKTPFSSHYPSDDRKGIIEFGKHLNSKGEGEYFNYPLKTTHDLENWINSNCALGLGDVIYPSLHSFYNGGDISYKDFSFKKESDGMISVGMTLPFIKGTRSILTTPPIPVDLGVNYTIEFLSKCSTSIQNRDRLLFAVSTLDENFKKNNGNIHSLNVIPTTTTYLPPVQSVRHQ